MERTSAGSSNVDRRGPTRNEDYYYGAESTPKASATIHAIDAILRLPAFSASISSDFSRSIAALTTNLLSTSMHPAEVEKPHGVADASGTSMNFEPPPVAVMKRKVLLLKPKIKRERSPSVSVPLEAADSTAVLPALIVPRFAAPCTTLPDMELWRNVVRGILAAPALSAPGGGEQQQRNSSLVEDSTMWRFVSAPLRMIRSTMLPTAAESMSTGGDGAGRCLLQVTNDGQVVGVLWSLADNATLVLARSTGPLWEPCRLKTTEPLFILSTCPSSGLGGVAGTTPRQRPSRWIVVNPSDSACCASVPQGCKGPPTALRPPSKEIVFGSEVYLSLVARRCLMFSLAFLSGRSGETPRQHWNTFDLGIQELRRLHPALQFISSAVLQSRVLDRVAMWCVTSEESSSGAAGSSVHRLPDGSLRIQRSVGSASGSSCCVVGVDICMNPADVVALKRCEWKVVQTSSCATTGTSAQWFWFLPKLPAALFTIAAHSAVLSTLLTPSMKRSLLRCILYSLHHHTQLFSPSKQHSAQNLAADSSVPQQQLLPWMAECIAAGLTVTVTSPGHLKLLAAMDAVCHCAHIFTRPLRVGIRKRRVMQEVVSKVLSCMSGEWGSLRLLDVAACTELMDALSLEHRKEMQEVAATSMEQLQQSGVSVAAARRQPKRTGEHENDEESNDLCDLFDDDTETGDAKLPSNGDDDGERRMRDGAQKGAASLGRPSGLLRRCKRTGKMEYIQALPDNETCEVLRIWTQKASISHAHDVTHPFPQCCTQGEHPQGISSCPWSLLAMFRIRPQRGTIPTPIITSTDADPATKDRTKEQQLSQVDVDDDDVLVLPGAPSAVEVQRYTRKKMETLGINDASSTTDVTSAKTIVSLAMRAKKSRQERWKEKVWWEIIQVACRDAGIADGEASRLVSHFSDEVSERRQKNQIPEDSGVDLALSTAQAYVDMVLNSASCLWDAVDMGGGSATNDGMIARFGACLTRVMSRAPYASQLAEAFC